MKRFSLLLVAVLLAIGAMTSSDALGAGSATGWVKFSENGTITYKCTIDGDSATSLGVDYRSDSAVFTEWVNVPVGIPFWIYTESRDADSSKAFGPDTVHIGLFTAPKGSRAVDSLNIRHQNKQQLLWDYGSINWRTFCQQTYFSLQHADTLPGDTVPVAAGTGRAAGTGGRSRLHNMGMLRFGLTMDDSDSLTDSGVRFNVFIVYQANTIGKFGYEMPADSYGMIERGVATEPQWAWLPRNERY